MALCCCASSMRGLCWKVTLRALLMSEDVVAGREEENGHIDLGSVTEDIGDTQWLGRSAVDRKGDRTHGTRSKSTCDQDSTQRTSWLPYYGEITGLNAPRVSRASNLNLEKSMASPLQTHVQPRSTLFRKDLMSKTKTSPPPSPP